MQPDFFGYKAADRLCFWAEKKSLGCCLVSARPKLPAGLTTELTGSGSLVQARFPGLWLACQKPKAQAPQEMSFMTCVLVFS